MTDTQPELKLYGVPFSQPVRAVLWLLLYKQKTFELVLTNPGSKGDNGSRNPAFLAKNPAGTIPTLEIPATGFVLGEAHAILCYLCNREGWDDLYPSAPEARAAVDWYLHYHHRNLRDASIGLVAPKIRKDLNIPEVMQQSALATLQKALQALETGWLADQPYLCGPSVTIADLAAYVEIGQLQPQYTNVFDFAPYPQVRAWLERMQQLPCHDDVHLVLEVLGDISQEAPSMETIKSANKQSLVRLKECLSAMAQ